MWIVLDVETCLGENLWILSTVIEQQRDEHELPVHAGYHRCHQDRRQTEFIFTYVDEGQV